MIKIRAYILLLTLVVVSVAAVAQQLDDYDDVINSALSVQLLYDESQDEASGSLLKFKERLTSQLLDDDYLFFEPGVITISEDRSAKSALEQVEAKEDRGVMGFRVGIFFSNKASGRADANAVIERCAKEFAGVPVTLSYDNPYFKVQAGYATTNEEAVMLLNRLQKRFPKAYLVRERIDPKNLVEVYEAEMTANNVAQQIRLMSELLDEEEGDEGAEGAVGVVAE